jgi:putative transposase
MPDHFHIVLVPSDSDGLARTFGELHRRYTGYVNARRRTTGHLWLGRFSSVAMDEAHFVTALRYVALSPVRARLVERAEMEERTGMKLAPAKRGPVPRNAQVT